MTEHSWRRTRSTAAAVGLALLTTFGSAGDGRDTSTSRDGNLPPQRLPADLDCRPLPAPGEVPAVTPANAALVGEPLKRPNASVMSPLPPVESLGQTLPTIEVESVSRSSPTQIVRPAAVQIAPLPELLELMPSAPAENRSPRIEAAAARALECVRRGQGLAQRNAVHSATADFLGAIAELATALDAEAGDDSHTAALSEGQRAIDEADDFLPRAAGLDGPVDVAAAARIHRTPVLRESVHGIGSAEARERYLAFAGERLADAVQSEPVGSAALYSLGKLYASLPQDEATRIGSPDARATAYFHAALLADPRNAAAANELGVLLGRAGRLEEARGALLLSLAQSPHPTVWHNLAQVHLRLGEAQLADQARQRSLVAQISEAGQGAGVEGHGNSRQTGQQPGVGGHGGVVEWVPPSRFQDRGQDLGVRGHGAGVEGQELGVGGQAVPSTSTPAAETAITPPQKRLSGWWSWNAPRNK